MEDQIKEKLLLVKEKFQRFSLYLAKQYVRTKRDIHRMLHPRDGSTWRGKKLHRWNMAELIDFFKNEVGVSNKALHRLEESEIDGAILDITLDSEDGDEALMETLKIDALPLSLSLVCVCTCVRARGLGTLTLCTHQGSVRQTKVSECEPSRDKQRSKRGRLSPRHARGRWNVGIDGGGEEDRHPAAGGRKRGRGWHRRRAWHRRRGR